MPDAAEETALKITQHVQSKKKKAGRIDAFHVVAQRRPGFRTAGEINGARCLRAGRNPVAYRTRPGPIPPVLERDEMLMESRDAGKCSRDTRRDQMLPRPPGIRTFQPRIGSSKQLQLNGLDPGKAAVGQRPQPIAASELDGGLMRRGDAESGVAQLQHRLPRREPFADDKNDRIRVGQRAHLFRAAIVRVMKLGNGSSIGARDRWKGLKNSRWR